MVFEPYKLILEVTSSTDGNIAKDIEYLVSYQKIKNLMEKYTDL